MKVSVLKKSKKHSEEEFRKRKLVLDSSNIEEDNDVLVAHYPYSLRNSLLIP